MREGFTEQLSAADEELTTHNTSDSHSTLLSSQFNIWRIPRSREVHQSWTSSVVSTLNALRYSLPLVFKVRPDVVSAWRGALGRPSRPLEDSAELNC